MELSSWKTQLRKGAAELAVLAALADRPHYGLEIFDRIAASGVLAISKGTLYPLLNRLHREGKLGSEWVEDEGASHPRKYYSLTDEGLRMLSAMKAEWQEFTSGMDRLFDDRPSGKNEAGDATTREPESGADDVSTK